MSQDSIADGVAKIVATLQRVQAMTSTPGEPAEGSDDTGAVRAAVDETGALQSVTVVPRWQDKLDGVSGLEKAIRLAAARAVSTSQGWEQPDVSSVDREWDVAELQAEAERYWDEASLSDAARTEARGMIDDRLAWLQSQQSKTVEEARSDLQAQAERLTGALADLAGPPGGAATAAGEQAKVQLSLSTAGMLTAIRIDPRWGAGQSGTGIMSAIAEILQQRADEERTR